MSKKWTPAELAAVAGAVVLAAGGIVAAWVSRGAHGPDNVASSPTAVPAGAVAGPQPIPQSAPQRVSGQAALDTLFFPSGWMGDGRLGTKHLTLTAQSVVVSGRSLVASRIVYSPGPDGWAGIYWQYPDKNWGDAPGRTLTGMHEVAFLARGLKGGEIVEFKAGGIRGKNSDSFEKSLGKVPLRKDWRPFSIDLSQSDLSSVIGAFAVVIAAGDNAGGQTTIDLADLILR